MGDDLDILLYVVLFIMGAIVAITDRAASAVKCKANGKIFKFYPIRHISTALAVIFAIAAFIYYAAAEKSDGVRNNVMGILGLALILITVTFVYDLFLIFWRFNKKRADRKASGAAAEGETGEISQDALSADESGADVSDDDVPEDEKEGEKEEPGEDET